MWPRLSYGQCDVNRVSHDTSGKSPYKEIFTRSSLPLSFIFSAPWEKDVIGGAPAALQNHKDERLLSRNWKRPRLSQLEKSPQEPQTVYLWTPLCEWIKACILNFVWVSVTMQPEQILIYWSLRNSEETWSSLNSKHRRTHKPATTIINKDFHYSVNNDISLFTFNIVG